MKRTDFSTGMKSRAILLITELVQKVPREKKVEEQNRTEENKIE